METNNKNPNKTSVSSISSGAVDPIQSRSLSRGRVNSLQTVNIFNSLKKIDNKIDTPYVPQEIKDLLGGDQQLLYQLINDKVSFAIRISHIYHKIYKIYIANNPLKRELLRKTIEQSIVGLAKIDLSIINDHQINLTITPNIVIENKVEAKAEANANVSINVLVQIRQEVEWLMEFIHRALSVKTTIKRGGREVEVPAIHPATAKRIIERLNKISKLVSN